MSYNAFLHPEIIQDTPRFFTAIAEWLAVFLYLNIYKRRYESYKYVIGLVLSFLTMTAIQFVAGILSIWFWIPTMIAAVAIMYVSIFFLSDNKPMDCLVITIQAFVLAEFTASLYRQLCVWEIRFTSRYVFSHSLIIMMIVYALVYFTFYQVEKHNYHDEMRLDISRRELLSVLTIGIGSFIMSNISFVWTATPFSEPTNMLYVRTLVDFGGMLMLMNYIARRNELAFKTESDAINQLFQKQYEQYRLALDNSELLRKEMHDMKHYILALKGEEDPVKRNEILADIEQSIAIQESFMNTGNKVLDVVLTTKGLQCEKKGITLNAMVDGDVLSGIHVKDICSLFGNILDNAIEATQLVEDKEHRLITLTVKQKNQFIIIECENYCDCFEGIRDENGDVVFSKDNMPTTTKLDEVHHGFGLKSILQVSEKYGGAMKASVEGNWFRVKVLLSAKK